MNDVIRIIKLSPKIAARKIIKKLSEKLDNSKGQDLLQNLTYSSAEKSLNFPFHLFPISDQDISKSNVEEIQKKVENILVHRFDLLGSGETSVHHGLIAPGMKEYSYTKQSNYGTISDIIESYPNLQNKEFARSLTHFLPDAYTLIDWQIDFKSGFRWDELKASKDIVYGNSLGADIKVPWELGRMQHLVLLANAFRYFEESQNSTEAQRIIDEFCYQVTDFYLSNPPIFGTQWMSTMDVAIRAVNLLVGRSFLLQSGAKLDNQFEHLFKNLIADHTNFIKDNLEWSSGMRGNHYLAGVSGLLILACHQSATEQSDELITFALNELINEIFYQFHSDGGNFEGSLAYHRFSFEMLCFGLFSFLSLPNIRLIGLKNKAFNEIEIDLNGQITISSKLIIRLFKIFEFQVFASSAQGYSPQIGDNDSGYFLDLCPNFSKTYSPQNTLKILTFFAGFFTEYFDTPFFSQEAEFYISRSMRNRSKIEFPERDISPIIHSVINYTTTAKTQFSKAFHEFGLYVTANDSYKFLMHCGSIGQKGKGGHNHNDQLSFELLIDNEPVIVDAGTYCYTPIPSERNKYRSVTMHNTLIINDLEQNLWHSTKKDDLFWLDGDSTKSKMIEFSTKKLIAQHKAYPAIHRREIAFEDKSLHFKESYKAKGTRSIHIHLAPGLQLHQESDSVRINLHNRTLLISSEGNEISTEPYLYSPEYGVQIEAYRIVIASSLTDINWTVVL